MIFKNEDEAIKWVRLNIPFAVNPKRKAKTTFIYPYVSYHAHMQVVEFLGKELYKHQTEKP